MTPCDKFISHPAEPALCWSCGHLAEKHPGVFARRVNFVNGDKVAQRLRKDGEKVAQLLQEEPEDFDKADAVRQLGEALERAEQRWWRLSFTEREALLDRAEASALSNMSRADKLKAIVLLVLEEDSSARLPLAVGRQVEKLQLENATYAEQLRIAHNDRENFRDYISHMHSDLREALGTIGLITWPTMVRRVVGLVQDRARLVGLNTFFRTAAGDLRSACDLIRPAE